MKGKLKKGITILSLASVMAFAGTSLSACSDAENDNLETIGNGYIILNDKHPDVYRLHRFVIKNHSLYASNNTSCGYTLYDCNMNKQQYMFVLEKQDAYGNIISRQFEPYIKVIADGVEIDPECYDEVCEECFPNSIG